MVIGIVPNTWLFFVKTVGAFLQGSGTSIDPKSAQSFLQMLKSNILAQGHSAVQMDFVSGVES
jgi:hypothetical protein